jgi:ketosteroid isomerase-like protein
MSQENVEVVRQVYEAAARRDTSAVFALYAPDIEWDASRTSRGAMAGRVVHGHDALRAWLRDWYGAWEKLEDRLEELIDVDDDNVVAIMVQRGRGRASGVDVEDRLGAVWTLRDGKVVRVVWFPTREAALEAVGRTGCSG